MRTSLFSCALIALVCTTVGCSSMSSWTPRWAWWKKNKSPSVDTALVRATTPQYPALPSKSAATTNPYLATTQTTPPSYPTTGAPGYNVAGSPQAPAYSPYGNPGANPAINPYGGTNYGEQPQYNTNPNMAAAPPQGGYAAPSPYGPAGGGYNAQAAATSPYAASGNPYGATDYNGGADSRYGATPDAGYPQTPVASTVPAGAYETSNGAYPATPVGDRYGSPTASVPGAYDSPAANPYGAQQSYAPSGGYPSTGSNYVGAGNGGPAGNGSAAQTADLRNGPAGYGVAPASAYPTTPVPAGSQPAFRPGGTGDYTPAQPASSGTLDRYGDIEGNSHDTVGERYALRPDGVTQAGGVLASGESAVQQATSVQGDTPGQVRQASTHSESQFPYRFQR